MNLEQAQRRFREQPNAGRAVTYLRLATEAFADNTLRSDESFAAMLREVAAWLPNQRAQFSWRQVLREEEISSAASGAIKLWEPAGGRLTVHLRSYSEALDHQQFDRLIGKTVQITVEVVEAP